MSDASAESLADFQVPVSKLAMIIPPAKKTGNTSMYYDKGMEWQALIDVISWLEKYPEHGMSTFNFIMDRAHQAKELQGIDGSSSFGE
eukprot:16224531-Heterocapsa_arctica.AAC.1